jgi:FOG: Ankyrin repeat
MNTSMAKTVQKIMIALIVIVLVTLAGCTSNEKAMIEAIKNGDVVKVQNLLDKGISANLKTDDGNSVLMLAAYLDKIDIAKLLIDKGADVNATDNNGKTALMYAAEKGNLDIAKLLLEKGAQIDAVDKNGKTALNIAEENNQKELADFLRNWNKPANLQISDLTPAPKISTQPTITPVSTVKPISLNDSLLNAVKEENLDKTKELLNEGANINSKDQNGKTALMFASEEGNFDLVKLLVEKGANILAKDNSGKTAIKYAIDNHHNDIATYLMQKAGIKK